MKKTRTRKTIVALMLVLALGVAGIIGSFCATTTASFTDVPTTHWAFESIEFCAKNGLVAGYGNGKFGPTDTLTYSQFYTLVDRVCYPEESAAAVAGGGEYWYTPYVNVARGHSLGDNVVANDNWNETSGIPRAHMAQIMYNALKDYMTGITVQEKFTPAALAKEGMPKPYDNSRAINACATIGLLNGYTDGTFGPNNTLTRAEAAAVVYRMYNLLQNGVQVVETPKPQDNEKPVTPPSGDVLDTPIKNLSMADVQDAVVKQTYIEINNRRATAGLPALGVNSYLETGSMERAPLLANSYAEAFADLAASMNDTSLRASGLKIYTVGKRINQITISGNNTPREIAKMTVDELQNSMNKYFFEQTAPTIMGAGIHFQGNTNWWENVYYYIAEGCPTNVKGIADSAYKNQLGITF